MLEKLHISVISVLSNFRFIFIFEFIFQIEDNGWQLEF